MDMRNKRYQELRERCLQEKTRKEDEKERHRKKLLKQFLDKQVNIIYITFRSRKKMKD